MGKFKRNKYRNTRIQERTSRYLTKRNQGVTQRSATTSNFVNADPSIVFMSNCAFQPGENCLSRDTVILSRRCENFGHKAQRHNHNCIIIVIIFVMVIIIISSPQPASWSIHMKRYKSHENETTFQLLAETRLHLLTVICTMKKWSG